MQDIYANSTEDMVFKLELSLEQGCEKEPIESQPRLGLIWFKTFHSNLKMKSF